MGLLDGGLQRVALGAFGAILMNGEFRRVIVNQTRDGRGRILQTDAQTNWPCKAFFERVTDQMRANGYQNRDVQCVMLQLTPDGRQIPEPVEGDGFQLRGAWYQVAAPIDQDPAMAAWTFRGQPARAIPVDPDGPDLPGYVLVTEEDDNVVIEPMEAP